MVTSMVLLTALVQWYSICVWPCTGLLGIGYGVIIPSVYVWISNFIAIGRTYWTGFSIGATLLPTLTGFLFDTVNQMSFPFLMLSCATGMCLSYIGLNIAVAGKGEYIIMD